MNLRPDEESAGELICNPSTIILPLQHLRSSTEITLVEISRNGEKQYAICVSRNFALTQHEHNGTLCSAKIDWEERREDVDNSAARE